MSLYSSYLSIYQLMKIVSCFGRGMWVGGKTRKFLVFWLEVFCCLSLTLSNLQTICTRFFQHYFCSVSSYLYFYNIPQIESYISSPKSWRFHGFGLEVRGFWLEVSCFGKKVCFLSRAFLFFSKSN